MCKGTHRRGAKDAKVAQRKVGQRERPEKDRAVKAGAAKGKDGFAAYSGDII